MLHQRELVFEPPTAVGIRQFKPLSNKLAKGFPPRKTSPNKLGKVSDRAIFSFIAPTLDEAAALEPQLFGLPNSLGEPAGGGR